MPVHCKHKEKENPRLVRCAHLSAACGFVRSVTPDFCAECRKLNGPHKDPLSVPLLKDAVMRGLRARLTAGDAPRYQEANPVDVDAAFAKLIELTDRDAAVDTLRVMFRHQTDMDEGRGGHAPEVLAQKLVRLAERHDMMRELEDVIHEYQRNGNSVHGGRAR